jgi:hypothetical protein
MRVPLLASLGAMACFTPYAQGAVSIKDDDLTVNIGMDLQARAQWANASTGSGTAATNGEPYDVFRAAPGESNDVDMNIRRARLLIDGSYTASWKFNMSFNADNVDRNGDNGAPTNTANTPGGGVTNNPGDNSREVQLFKAYLRHIWKLDEGLELYAQGGLDYPFFNRAIVGDPWWLFAQQRASGNLMGNRAVGTRVMLSGEMFDWGFDIDESMDPGQPAQAANTPADGDNLHREGLFYSTRLEYTVFSDTGRKALYHESYQGKPGHSLMLTGDIGYDNNDYGLAGERVNAYCYGFEALYHMDGLSVLAEGRCEHIFENAYAGGAGNDKIMSTAYCIQAGYAFPAMGIIVEPCLRAQRLDLDLSMDQPASYNNNTALGNGAAGANANRLTGNLGVPYWLVQYGGADRMNSGNQFDVGCNWIFSPYTLMQTSYTRWNGFASTGGGNHPDANIVRAQLQLYF